MVVKFFIGMVVILGFYAVAAYQVAKQEAEQKRRQAFTEKCNRQLELIKYGK